MSKNVYIFQTNSNVKQQKNKSYSRKNNSPDIASKKDHIFLCFFGCLPPPRSVGDFFPFKDSYLICLKPKEETKEL
ncbi:hypothetical protein GQ457_06G021380 [Hibiscus cannabinus]